MLAHRLRAACFQVRFYLLRISLMRLFEDSYGVIRRPALMTVLVAMRPIGQIGCSLFPHENRQQSREDPPIIAAKIAVRVVFSLPKDIIIAIATD